jgi:serine/threonine-protein kinase
VILIGETTLKIRIIEKEFNVWKNNENNNVIARIIRLLDEIKGIDIGVRFPIPIVKPGRKKGPQKDHPIPSPNPPINKWRKYFCNYCSRDLGTYANSDNMADYLIEDTQYVCDECIKNRYEKNTDIGSYIILKALGKGGMGEVFMAWHKHTYRIVALKRIVVDHQKEEIYEKSFEREMTIHRQLYHENIVKMLDGGYDSTTNQYFFVSEFMPDGDIAQLMKREYGGRLPFHEACDLIIQILKGLEYMHVKGEAVLSDKNSGFTRIQLEDIRDSFVHRDIKPYNIFISFTKKGNKILTAKLGDFGIAKSVDNPENTLSETNSFKGSPYWMPPEQMADSKYAQPSVDVYAVGVTLYYLLTAKYPFALCSPFEQEYPPYKHEYYILTQDERTPILKKNPSIPRELANIIDYTIKRDLKDRRYKTARALREALENFLQKSR